MSRTDELRLMLRVAHLYHEGRLKQAEISEQLHLSQAKVSRLLQRAEAEGVIRVSINVPSGTYPQLEEGLRQRYGLNEAIVAECYEDRDEQILSAIGSAAGHYFESTLGEGEVIGVSSWSISLLRTVDAIRPIKRLRAERVVQIVGGIGNPSVQGHATQMVTRLATLTGSEPQLLPARGVVSSREAREVMLSDTYVRAVMDQFKRLTVALVGIGALRPSAVFANSGSAFTDEEIDEVARLGVVGESSLRFFDHDGRPVYGPLDDRVIGISLEELKAVPRVIGVAGGSQKVDAIRACLTGKLINVLVTDRFTAEKLL